MTGPELCERTFESDACRQILMTPVAFWEHGAPFARGQGAFGAAFALYYTTGIGLGGNEVAGRRPHPVLLGARRLHPHVSVVDRIVVQDGRAIGVGLSERSLHPGTADRCARRRYLQRRRAGDAAPGRASRRCSAADARLGAKMRHWKMGLRGSHVTSWLLDGRVTGAQRTSIH